MRDVMRGFQRSSMPARLARRVRGAVLAVMHDYARPDHICPRIRGGAIFVFTVYSNFRKEPHLFLFRGNVNKYCHLDPVTYRARFS